MLPVASNQLSRAANCAQERTLLPAPPCQGAFHCRHQRACVPRRPGLTAAFIAANYRQRRCRGDGARKMGSHLPRPNDVRLCGLRWQPPLPTERGGISPQPPTLHPYPLHPTAARCKCCCGESCIPKLRYGSREVKVTPGHGDPETSPCGWEQRQRGAAGSGPPSAAAERSEASHCEKNEQIIGFSGSSKGERARPRRCAAPREEPPGRSRPAAQPPGRSQQQSSRPRASGDRGPECCEGTRPVGTSPAMSAPRGPALPVR